MAQDPLVISLQSKEGNEKAFTELVDTYHERLYWHVRKIVINHEDTHDVVQNVFIKVHKSIANFKGDSALYTWLYRIATNESITFINKRARNSSFTTDQYQQTIIDNLHASTHFDGDAAQLKLQKAVASLPQKQQLVFNMKYFDDLKYTEISQILETSEGALKANYHHAVKKIKAYILNVD